MKSFIATAVVASFFFPAAIYVPAAGHKVKSDSVSDAPYSIVSGAARLAIDASAGARITSLKLDGYEFLTGPDVMKGNYGSTFWPSPQSDWNWPPPSVLDSDPYAAFRSGDTLEFQSGEDRRTGLQVTKRLYPAGGGAFRITYIMRNISGAEKKVAPWEITRVRKGGILFFPVGSNKPGKKSFSGAPVRIVDGVAWYRDSMKRPPENLLTTSDLAEGWGAYAVDGKLFLKKFPLVGSREVAPGEGELAFYVSAVADYVEFEEEGRYVTLHPSESSAWHVEWIVVKVPEDVRVFEGSRALVDFARQLAR